MLSSSLVLAAKSLAILFIGNSHTAYNDVAGSVCSLLRQTLGSQAVQTTVMSAGLLEDAAQSSSIRQAAANPAWDVVVLQGAKVSSSHQYTYSQAGAILLANLALKAGSRVLLFAEWPRRGWDETDYTLGVYKVIANEAQGAEIVTVGRVWDAYRKTSPNAPLWSSDGNHAAPLGSYLAACSLAQTIFPSAKDVVWQPANVDAAAAKQIRSLTRKFIR